MNNIPLRENYGIFADTLLTKYILGDLIIVHPQNPRITRQFSAVSLALWAKALANRPLQNNIVSEARQYINHIFELEFCLSRLIPYLKFLNTANEACLLPEPGLAATLSDISWRAAILREAICAPVLLDRIKEAFCQPCEIKGNQVIPLELINGTQQGEVNIRNIWYRRRWDKAKLLIQTLNEVTEIVHGGEKEIVNKEEITTLVNDIKHLIAQFKPVQQQNYQIFYCDRNHQVQHNCGNFMLVRGPVPFMRRRLAPQIYFGLVIAGKSRSEWLYNRPSISPTQSGFWVSTGTPLAGRGICMGNASQYHKLLSPSFTDAEAVVHWLNAGVRIATGISSLHQQQRKTRMMVNTLPNQRRLILKI